MGVNAMVEMDKVKAICAFVELHKPEVDSGAMSEAEYLNKWDEFCNDLYNRPESVS